MSDIFLLPTNVSVDSPASLVANIGNAETKTTIFEMLTSGEINSETVIIVEGFGGNAQYTPNNSMYSRIADSLHPRITSRSHGMLPTIVICKIRSWLCDVVIKNEFIKRLNKIEYFKKFTKPLTLDFDRFMEAFDHPMGFLEFNGHKPDISLSELSEASQYLYKTYSDFISDLNKRVSSWINKNELFFKNIFLIADPISCSLLVSNEYKNSGRINYKLANLFDKDLFLNGMHTMFCIKAILHSEKIIQRSPS